MSYVSERRSKLLDWYGIQEGGWIVWLTTLRFLNEYWLNKTGAKKLISAKAMMIIARTILSPNKIDKISSKEFER